MSALVCAALASAVLFTTPALAQLKVITSGGFFAAYQQLEPEFEISTGIVVTTGRGPSQGNGPGTIAAQLRRGVPADVVIMSREGLNELIADGRISQGTDIDLARVPHGIAVRTGAPKPDIATAGALKKTLLGAKLIAYQSTTIPYMTSKVLPQLGLSQVVPGKAIVGGAVQVANGEAEIVVAPASELLHQPGVDFVGLIPSELQSVATFSAAIVSGTSKSEEAKRLISFLTSIGARTAIRNSGMEPAN